MKLATRYALVTGIGLIILSGMGLLTSSASEKPNTPITPALQATLTDRTLGAYRAFMDAAVDDTAQRYPDLTDRLSDLYSNTHLDHSPVVHPTSKPLTQAQIGQRDAVLREKQIDPQSFLAAQADEEAQMIKLTQMSPLERVRGSQTTRWTTAQGDVTVTEAWGFTDFTVESINVVRSDATVVAVAHEWARYRHSAPTGKVDLADPHNSTRYNFHFRQEGATWKVIDWSFDFLPEAAP